MPIEVTCDACSLTYRVRDDRAGTTVKCKDCGSRIDVPDEDSDDTDPPESRKRSSSKSGGRGAKRGKSSGSGNQMLIIAGGAGLAVLALVIILIFVFNRGDKAPEVAADAAAGGQPAAPGAAGVPGAPGVPNPIAPGNPMGAPIAGAPPIAPNAANPQNLAGPMGAAVAAIPGGPANPLLPAPAVGPMQPVFPAQVGVPAPAVLPNAVQHDLSWRTQVDPPPAGFAWPEQVKLTIPIPGNDDALFGPSSQSPFVSLGYAAYESTGAQMWNLATGKQVGEIRGNPSKAYMRTVSPDGKYLAIKVLDAAQGCIFELWSFETGKLVRTIVDEEKPSVSLMDFGPNNELVYYALGPNSGPGVKFGARIKFWDIAQGVLLRQLPLESQVTTQYCAFSPGHRYLASTNYSHELHVIDLLEGKISGMVKLPAASDLSTSLNPEAVRFTDDGSSIVVMLDGPTETRLTTIDVKTGTREADKDISFLGRVLSSIDGAASYKGPKLECLPGGGFLIAGSMWVDGESGRVIWSLDNGPDPYNFERRVPVPNGLIVPEGARGAKRLTVLDMPWKDIKASLKAIDSDQPAIVKPGQAVSLDVKIGRLEHGTAEETSKALSDALTERLAAVGIEVKEGQSTVLRIDYKEGAGDKLQESKRDPKNPLGLTNGIPTGREIQATRASLTASWVREADKKPAWTNVIDVNPQFLIIRGEITPEKARAAMFEGLKNQLLSQPMPYFIPEDKALTQLPGISTFRDPKLAGDSRTKALLDAAKKRKK